MIHEQNGPGYGQLRTLGIALSMVLMHWAHGCLTPYLVLLFDWVLRDWHDQARVFTTSLIANLLSGAKLPQFVASAQDRIELAYLNPQPNDTIARFDYETHLAQLYAHPPTWPDNTKGISTLRLTLKLRPTGLLSGLRGAVEEHIDIVDYPGEWLLDLGLMDKSYEEWSKDVLHRMANRSFGADYVNALPAKLPPSRRWCQSHGLICWRPLAQTSE